MSTRRQFLAVTSAAALASSLPCNAFTLSADEEVFSNRNLGAYQQGLLTLEIFQQLVGSQFRVFLTDGSVVYLTLTDVTDRSEAGTSAKSTSAKTAASQTRTGTAASALRPAPSVPTVSAFDLEFTTTGRTLEQQSYTIDHARLGRFAALLVPSRKTSAGSTYYMSFNYFSDAATASGPARGQFLTQSQTARSTAVR